MHELSLSSAIVEAAQRHAGGARVKVVSVRVGALRLRVPEALDWCRTCGGRSVAVTAGAELELESIVVEDGACTASS